MIFLGKLKCNCMKWSKLKQLIESSFTDKLKGRVTIYSTIYRTTGADKDGRGWIVVDKKEVFSACTSKWTNEMYVSHRFDGMDLDDAIGELYNNGVMQQHEFYNALFEFISLPIDQALNSENVVIRALAMIDKRVGKRRLQKIKLKVEEHALVKTLYKLRCEVEGIDPAM